MNVFNIFCNPWSEIPRSQDNHIFSLTNKCPTIPSETVTSCVAIVPVPHSPDSTQQDLLMFTNMANTNRLLPYDSLSQGTEHLVLFSYHVICFSVKCLFLLLPDFFFSDLLYFSKSQEFAT